MGKTSADTINVRERKLGKIVAQLSLPNTIKPIGIDNRFIV